MNADGVHRPRNVDWKRAAALLYGDWGTSKAYVIGLAFAAAGFASLPIILAVCTLTAVVGFLYVLVCRAFPEGAGVYASAREHSRLLAVTGSLLLIADLTVTASLSAWAGLSYLGVPEHLVPALAIAMVAALGLLNAYGPKHTGTLAVALALPTALVVLAIILLSAPHLTLSHLEPPHDTFPQFWVSFVGVILALSGVETIASLTGVMRPDPDSPPQRPRVGRTAFSAIWPVAIEVSVGTALLGWAMLSLPSDLAPQLAQRKEDMLRFLGEHYATLNFGAGPGHAFGWVVGVVFALLLLSAVNTAIVALVGMIFLLARDGEMPPTLARLNRHGVPSIPLLIAVTLPAIVLLVVRDFQALAGLYAIGVVGAITVDLGSCSANAGLGLTRPQRLAMGAVALLLAAIWLTLARTKPDALFFAVCVVGGGLALRGYAQRARGLSTITVSREMAEAVDPETIRPLAETEGGRFLVAARGVTPVLDFALREAKLHRASLYVLYIHEIAVNMPANPAPGGVRSDWRSDPAAAAIMGRMIAMGQANDVPVVPLYAVSHDPAFTIIDLAAILGVDSLFLGSAHRLNLARILKGNLVERVARQLPENVQLIIYG